MGIWGLEIAVFHSQRLERFCVVSDLIRDLPTSAVFSRRYSCAAKDAKADRTRPESEHRVHRGRRQRSRSYSPGWWQCRCAARPARAGDEWCGIVCVCVCDVPGLLMQTILLAVLLLQEAGWPKSVDVSSHSSRVGTPSAPFSSPSCSTVSAWASNITTRCSLSLSLAHT